MNYDRLIEEYFYRDFSKEEMEFLESELKNRIVTGVELFSDEIIVAVDLFYYEDGDILEILRHGYVKMEIILKLGNDEFYLVYGYHHSDNNSEYDEQVLTRVEAKLVKRYAWVKYGEDNE